MVDAAYMMRRFGDRQGTSAIASSAMHTEEHVARADAPLLVFHDRRARSRHALDRTVCGRPGLRRQPRRNRSDEQQRRRCWCDERRPAHQ